jgi:hypothetical protein
LPRLARERRSVPDVAHLDPTPDELTMRRLDVGDDQPALGRAWLGNSDALAEGDRGPGAWGGVNWTMRRPSNGATSLSSLQPRPV